MNNTFDRSYECDFIKKDSRTCIHCGKCNGHHTQNERSGRFTYHCDSCHCRMRV